MTNVLGKDNHRKPIPTGLKLFLLSVPFIIFVFAFYYVPLFGWAFAFYKYIPGMPFNKLQFIGLQKFKEIFSSTSDFGSVLRNTLIMSGIGILFSPASAIFAILLNEIRSNKYKRAVQTVTTLPNFISWIIVFSLSFAMFSSDGIVLNLLYNTGIISTKNSLLGNNNIVWIFQAALGMWKSIGWGAILYLAAIAGIDSELYDAAKVDGANRFKRILHITVPGMLPTYFVLLLLSISNMLNNGLDQYFVFYNSLVSEHIRVLDYYAYQLAFLTHDYSMSTAIGMSKSIVSILLLFGANFVSKKVRGESII